MQNPKDPNSYRIVNYLGNAPRPAGSDLPYCAAAPWMNEQWRLPVGTSCDDIYFASLHDAQVGCAMRTKNPVVGHRHDCAWVGGDDSRSRDGKRWYCGDGRQCRDH